MTSLSNCLSYLTSTLLDSSLVKIDDDRLQALLEEIQTMRKFQT